MRSAQDKSKKPGKKALDRKFAARVIVDAVTFGDTEAARRHKISDRSVRRYRAALETDPDLAGLVQKAAHRQEAGVGRERRRLYMAIIAKLSELVDKATAKEFGAVVEALKAVGEQELAAKVLGGNVGGGADPEGPRAPEDSGSAGEGEADD